jgi:hypothetical protein
MAFGGALDPQPGPAPQPARPTLTNVAQSVGQIVALLGSVSAALYVTGLFSMGVKLWTLRLPWAAVLGDLPRDEILTRGVAEVFAPSLAAGVVIYLMARRRGLLGRKIIVWVASICIASAVLYGWYKLLARDYSLVDHRAVLTVVWVAAVYDGVFFAAALLFAGSSIVVAQAPVWRSALRLAALTVSLVPCLSFALAAVPLPVVDICGPAFPRDGLIGNLIGSTANDAYVSQRFSKTNATQIAVVPLSEAHVETIAGQAEGCGDLAPQG